MGLILNFVRRWTLLVAICFGAVVYLIFGFSPRLAAAADVLGPVFDAIFPFFVFLTLFLTFAKVDFHKMRPQWWHLVLLLAQFAFVAVLCGFVVVVGGSCRGVKLVAEVLLTCVIAPCAAAAPVVTSKLGGDLNGMTTFTLVSSVVASVSIPAVFPLLESGTGATFLAAFGAILSKLAVVLLLPLALGWLVRHCVSRLYAFIVRYPDLAFYSWSLSLTITSGITVKNMVHSQSSAAFILVIALASLAACLAQLAVGRSLGRRLGREVCCGQGMFQKNTALAIWVAYVYLTPEASIGAGCYILWQNIVNAIEIRQYDGRKAILPESK